MSKPVSQITRKGNPTPALASTAAIVTPHVGSSVEKTASIVDGRDEVESVLVINPR